MIIIAKHFEFEASHKLPDNEIYGKCRYLHGHTYKLLVEAKGNINANGWIMNFKDLKRIVNEVVIDKYDHSHLNEFFDIPTAEIMAKKIFEDLTEALSQDYLQIKLHSITLWETSNSYAKVMNE